MSGLDQREQPGRLPDRLAKRRVVAPLEERQHQYTEGAATQLVRKLMMAGCGCRSQSNQLYAIIRPQNTMAIHSASEVAPAIRIAFGGMPSTILPAIFG